MWKGYRETAYRFVQKAYFTKKCKTCWDNCYYTAQCHVQWV